MMESLFKDEVNTDFNLPKMKLNEEQSIALEKLKEWYYSYRFSRPFEITGAAGTGKTTLIKYLIQETDLNINNVLFLAYVGKASLAMARTGLRAQTIHSAIYDILRVPRQDNNKRYIREDGKIIYDIKFVKKESLPKEIQLIVIDEASMVPENIGKEIESFGIPTIRLGDLNQLPPVFGNSYFLKNPDVRLKKIMRQAEESPIPYFARDILDGRNVFKESIIQDKIFIFDRHRISTKFLKTLFKDNDIIICGTNKSRDTLNSYIRKNVFNKTSEEIEIGDKLICRRNDWSRCIDTNYFLINGMVGYVDDIVYERFTKSYIMIDFKPDFLENYLFTNVLLDRKYFHLPYDKKLNYFSDYNLFELGYAITCHLAQGSQYNNVCVVLDDYILHNKEFRRQWLYTAVTRAIDKLTILL